MIIRAALHDIYFSDTPSNWTHWRINEMLEHLVEHATLRASSHATNEAKLLPGVAWV